MAKDVRIPMGVGGWEAQNTAAVWAVWRTVWVGEVEEALSIAKKAWHVACEAREVAGKARGKTDDLADANERYFDAFATSRSAMQKAADAYATARNLEGRISALEQSGNLSRKSKRK